jgi:dTDP-4-amino-4,6-dideoxygalactose transaminase
LTNDEQIAKIVKKIRQYGWGEKYSVEIENGTNSRLDELQAAFLLAKLDNLDSWNQQRITIAKQYVNAFEKSKVKVLKNTLKGVAHLFVILTDDRDELVDHLTKNKIQSGIHYPIPDHKQAIYKEKFKDTNLPITDGSVGKILSLPIYPGMKQEEIDHVKNVISNF